jgi:hypothetical protein
MMAYPPAGGLAMLVPPESTVLPIHLAETPRTRTMPEHNHPEPAATDDHATAAAVAAFIARWEHAGGSGKTGDRPPGKPGTDHGFALD